MPGTAASFVFVVIDIAVGRGNDGSGAFLSSQAEIHRILWLDGCTRAHLLCKPTPDARELAERVSGAMLVILRWHAPLAG